MRSDSRRLASIPRTRKEYAFHASYNKCMPASSSNRRQPRDTRKAQHLETIGLIIIVILIIAIAVTRSWHHINWSAR
jgi:hypothetical protein